MNRTVRGRNLEQLLDQASVQRQRLHNAIQELANAHQRWLQDETTMYSEEMLESMDHLYELAGCQFIFEED